MTQMVHLMRLMVQLILVDGAGTLKLGSTVSSLGTLDDHTVDDIEYDNNLISCNRYILVELDGSKETLVQEIHVITILYL